MMRRWVLLLSLLLVLAGCSQPTIKNDGTLASGADKEKQTVQKAETDEVELVEPIDGDTAKFRVDGKVETVRFLLIDTPETHHPRLGEQPLGKEASEFTKNTLEQARRITLEYDAEKEDKYGRVLAYVYADGKSVQEELLKRGLARVGYIYESRRHLEDFRKAEDIAQEKKIGIWQCPGYVTDEGYDPDKWCKDGAEEKPDTGYTGPYNPNGPDRDCSDFATQAEAQAFYEAAGGPERDPHRLDPDKDGVACESLP